MNDLINRQIAINAIEMLMEQSEDNEHDEVWNAAVRGALYAVKYHVPTEELKPIVLKIDHVSAEDIKRIKQEFYKSTLVLIPYPERTELINDFNQEVKR